MVRTRHILFILLVAVSTWAGDQFSGELSGSGDSEEFEVVADYSPYEIAFHPPIETDFHVTVLGEDHDEIGDFRLTEGNIIRLSGGGSFYLRVSSNEGGGVWFAEEINDPDEYRGYLGGAGESEEFGIYLYTSPVHFVFDSPENADFYTTVYGEYHNPLGEYDLPDDNRILVTGGGQFYFEVWAESGSGPWAAYWLDAGETVFSNVKSGNLIGAGDSNEFPLYTQQDPTNVRFSYPKNADFQVTIYGREHNVLGDYRLEEGNEIQLIGGGQFFVEIYTKDEGGQWTASW
ncbi:MAG: hypothetical protein GY771_07890 [bacterium]|nr:hypothetical protein [bacterium]